MPDRNSHFTGRGAGSWSALASCVGALLALAACGGTPTPSPSVTTGLPADWSAQAIRAATASFRICAQANSLQPPNCPQSLGAGEALAVHWTVLSVPLDHAVAVPVQQDAAATAAGQVTVYGQYQMSVSYTTAGQTVRPYLDYVGGIAEATMTWDGRSFQNIQFATNDAASKQPPRTLPAQGLAIPNCPQQFAVIQLGTVTSAEWAVAGDPTQGALVSFDTDHGNFAVTGSYRMNLRYATDNGNPLSGDNGTHVGSSSGNYTATLAWDGHQFTLLKIDAS
jgi:hypothetical protein